MSSKGSDIGLEWLRNIANFKNPIPPQFTPFVRTRHINSKRDGCLICPTKRGITRHHIRRGLDPLAAYICWRHHQILHGIALHRHKVEDVSLVMERADAYNLYKDGEEKIIKKMLLTELERRKVEEGLPDFFRNL